MTMDDLDGCDTSIDGKQLDIWSSAILDRLIVPDGVTAIRVFHNTIPARFTVPESVSSIRLFNTAITDGFDIPSSVAELWLFKTLIPAGFTVPGSVTELLLSGLNIPDEFVVPAGVTKINLWQSTVTTGPIYTCPRGYELYTLPRADGDAVFWAGCRMFRSRAEAIAHWGSPKYPDPQRGAAFVAAINATGRCSV